MKNTLILLFLSLVVIQTAVCQTPAILDLQSTDQGVLIPRMTTAQKNAIATPPQSLMVYDITTKSFWYFEDTVWNELGSNDGPAGLINSVTHAVGSLIPDGDANGVEDVIVLTDPRSISSDTYIEVCLDIDHNFLADVDVTLTAPDGTTIIDLTSDNTGSFYRNTCFTTRATINVTDANNSFRGEFIPEAPLSNLVGQSIAGDWTIKVADDDGIPDNGTFAAWSLRIENIEHKTYRITDVDQDTKIETERTYDEDVLRFTTNDTEVLSMSALGANFTTDVTATSFIGDGSQLTGISGGGSATFYYDFSSFSNSSCCNNRILQQAQSVNVAASVFDNSTQPKFAYGKPLTYDVEVVSVQFLHRYETFTPSGSEALTIQPSIANLATGALDRHLTAPVDLRTAPQDTWIDLPLTSSVAADNLIDASALQYIVWEQNTAMSGGGELDGISILKVEVKIP